MNSSVLEKSTLVKEGPYQVSKFSKLFFLLSANELLDLFSIFSFSIHPLGGLLELTQTTMNKSWFVDNYSKQLDSFFEEKPFKFSPCLLTKDPRSLYLMETNSERVLLKMKRPVLYLKPLYFSFCGDKVFPALGKETIFWGFSLSYPQIFQDPMTKQFIKVGNEFENTGLFIDFRKKLRSLSSCVSFEKEGKKIATNFRLGRELKEKKHPDLIKLNINFWRDSEY